MEWLLKKVPSLIWTQPESSQEDNCSTCPVPCDTHPNYPEYLAKKVNQFKPLQGSVKPYGKHVVICMGGTNEDSTKWAQKVEKEENSFAQLLSQEIKKHDAAIGYRVLLTLTEDPSLNSGNQEGLDIILFPDMIRFPDVKRDQIPVLVKVFLHFVCYQCKYLLLEQLTRSRKC
jgi:hypothetical protein